jgi:hypothetical protein
MIANGIFGTANHYFVNSFIAQEFRSTTCLFETGLVATQIHANEDPFAPNPVWATAALTFRAYTNAGLNGGGLDCGNPGIYSKINNEAYYFVPKTLIYSDI